ncbi:hypothetical protein CK203_106196 [Vitis vinifera]|uniref:Uncharacterized protein n=1 Tax=Vitis vinifera TaxID=29760 RepID=A0A438CXT9_VITVI|nr:hypothetical protein CK203_106196 [Vitis vinifera]
MRSRTSSTPRPIWPSHRLAARRQALRGLDSGVFHALHPIQYPPPTYNKPPWFAAVVPAAVPPPLPNTSNSSSTRPSIGASGFGSQANTLTEPVWDTVKRDLSRIVSNLKLVCFRTRIVKTQERL